MAAPRMSSRGFSVAIDNRLARGARQRVANMHNSRSEMFGECTEAPVGTRTTASGRKPPS